MYSNFKEHLQSTINDIREAGLYKNERVIDGPQDASV
jgi:glycine C-acetyltransferase